MRHGEEPDEVDEPHAIPPIPWRDTVDLCFPSLGIEVVYNLPEEYEKEEPRAPSISPATMKRHAAEKDREEMSSWSDEYDPTGKTPEDVDVMIAKYNRDIKASLIEANGRRALEGM